MSVLTQTHPVHFLPSYFFTTHLILSSHLRLGLANGVLPSGSCVCVSFLPYMAHTSRVIHLDIVVLARRTNCEAPHVISPESFSSSHSGPNMAMNVTWRNALCNIASLRSRDNSVFNPYPTAFTNGNGMVLHFYQQQESSTTKTVHKVINKRLKTYV